MTCFYVFTLWLAILLYWFIIYRSLLVGCVAQYKINFIGYVKNKRLSNISLEINLPCVFPSHLDIMQNFKFGSYWLLFCLGTIFCSTTYQNRIDYVQDKCPIHSTNFPAP